MITSSAKANDADARAPAHAMMTVFFIIILLGWSR
jgi:hypothetical protein